jgi:hypothetical protein
LVQVSVAFEPQMAEGRRRKKMREPFPPRRREKENVKSQPETREDPALPFIRQGEQVTLVKREKEGERRCMHDMCAGGKSSSHAARPAVPVCCYCCM